jgi:hypothetical protein
VSLGLKYKLVTLKFGGAGYHLISDAYAERAHQFLVCTLSALISSWRARSVHASVPCAHAQYISKRDIFKLGIFMLMLSIRVRNWCNCSGYASVPDPNAQGTHLFLMRMLSMIWRDCPQCTLYILTHMLSVRTSSLLECTVHASVSECVCSVHASGPCAHAEGIQNEHLKNWTKLMRMHELARKKLRNWYGWSGAHQFLTRPLNMPSVPDAIVQLAHQFLSSHAQHAHKGRSMCVWK